MGGQYTAGYDLVLELSGEALYKLVGVALNTANFVCDLIDETFNKLPGVHIPCAQFEWSVSLNRPTDVPLAPWQTDAMDIRISHLNGLSEWSVRIVAGVKVDRSEPLADWAVLDYEQHLYHVEAWFKVLPIDADKLAKYLREKKRRTRLFPLPVERQTTSDFVFKQLDAKVIDAGGSAPDALAYGITFGGGVPGALPALLQTPFKPGDNAALMVGFNWVLRQLGPAVRTGLGIPADAFTQGHLTRPVVIDEKQGVSLTNLDFELKDGYIQVTTRIAKSGFCYTASAIFQTEFRVQVVDGRLQIDADVSDPELNLDIPWYCWIGAAFLGGLLAGIIGNVLVPVILYLVTSTVKSVVDNVADTLKGAMGKVNTGADVPAMGFNLIFQQAFIDDLTIGCRVQVHDTAPVRSLGTLWLSPGDALDLENGRVQQGSFAGADLAWLDGSQTLRLQALGSTSLADTRDVHFDEIMRCELFPLPYVSGRALSKNELGTWEHLDLPLATDVDWFAPTLNVYGVRTNEGRYALLQVIDFDGDRVRLRYRTYGVGDPALQILGAFGCGGSTWWEPSVDPWTVPELIHVPPPRELNLAETLGRLPEAVSRAATQSHLRARSTGQSAATSGLASGLTLRQRARLEELTKLAGSVGRTSALALKRSGGTVHVTAAELGAAARGAQRTLSESIGHWVGQVQAPRRPTGNFQGVVENIEVARVSWFIDTVLLDPAQSTASVGGITYQYQQGGLALSLAPQTDAAYEFDLRLELEARDGQHYTTSTHLLYGGACQREIRGIPHWTSFRGLTS